MLFIDINIDNIILMEKINHNKWTFETRKNKFSFKLDATTKENNTFNFDEIVYNYNDDYLKDFRKSAVVHRIVREQTKNILKSGISYSDIADFVETNVNKYIDSNGGMAFPVGISVNEIIAHDTALVRDVRYLKPEDIVKIDIGVQLNGKIIDSAFTHIVDIEDQMNHLYTPLLESTKDAVYTAISESGVDKSLYEISETIKEVIESYEIEENRIYAVNGLGGHNILPYVVHGGKLILSKPNDIQKNMRMEENEIYAIETFATTGTGNISKIPDFSQWSHFGLDNRIKNLELLKQKELKNPIILWNINNHCMPFTQRWLEKNSINNWTKYLKDGITHQNIVAYPPLKDKKGSYTSQFEHTICVKNGGVEILSLGNDY
jgi:methionyl aminopeptidase